MNWIDPDLAAALSAALLHSLWQSVIIAGIIYVISKSQVLKNEKQYYNLYLAGIFFALTTSVITFFYFYDSPALFSSVSAEPRGEFLSFYSSIDPSQPASWSFILSGFWSIGCMVFLLRILIGYFKVYTVVNGATMAPELWNERLENLKVNIGIGHKIQLKTTNQSLIPFIWGFSKPIIIIPVMYFTRLSPKEIESILLHELAHIKNYDFIFNFLQLLAESVLFYHPAIWWLSYQARMHREFRCDALVSEHSENIRTYLQALYQAAQINLSTPNTKVALLNNKTQLTMRIKRLTTKRTGNHPVNPVLSLCLLLFFTFTFFAFRNILTPSNESEIQSVDLLPQKTFLVYEMNADPNMVAWMPEKPVWFLGKMPDYDQNVESSKIRTNSVDTISGEFPILDTVPDEKKIKFLEQQLKNKEQDLALMEQKMQGTLAFKLEQSHLQLEGMAKKMKLAHQDLELDADHQQRMQELAWMEEKLAGKIEEMNHSLEKELESGVLRKQELEIEKKSIEIEELRLEGDLDKVKEKEKELQKMHLEMRKRMVALKEKQLEFMNDPELKKAKEELQKRQKNLQYEQQVRMNKMNSETHELQVNMQKLQKEMQSKIEVSRKEMMDVHQDKLDEIRKLNEELKKEKGNK